MGHLAIVGAALDLVSALAAGEGLALVGVPVFGVWGAPTEAHDLPAFWASRVIGLTSVVPLLTYTLPVNQGAAAKAPETSAPRRRPLLSQAQGVRHA
jgi:hypothetical protein